MTKTTSPTVAGQVRAGSEVLTTITGTIPGAAVVDLFKIGDRNGTFDVTYGLTDGDELRQVTLTGPFFGAGTLVDLRAHPRPVRRARHHHGPVSATGGRLPLLAAAAAAVALAAADTYIVVLALTDMMAGVGIGIDALQRATPIISGFLLGYIAVLPLIGRLSDLLDRRRILLGCLVVFVVGSAVTALAVEMSVLVTGRVLQGIGGGGLVPATLALVADLWPADRRGTPLGVVGAVQELGAVLGPVLGAVILAWAGWRAIFWVNVVAGLLLYAVIHLLGARALGAAPDGIPPEAVSARAAEGGRAHGARLAARGRRARPRWAGAGRSRVARHRRGPRGPLRAGRRALSGADADRVRLAGAARRARRRHGAAVVGGAATLRPLRRRARGHRARRHRADLRLLRPGARGRRVRSATRCCPWPPWRSAWLGGGTAGLRHRSSRAG